MFVPNDVLNASLYGDLYDDNLFDNYMYQAMENIFDFNKSLRFIKNIIISIHAQIGRIIGMN